jgi:TRAP-type C4-dicarboxylate transport system permease small subunit
MKAFNAVLYRALQRALTLLMGFLIIPVTMQIFSRYTALIPRYVWTDELSCYCLIWIIMLGAMIAVRDGTHFDLDILPKARSRQAAALGRIVTHVAMLLVGFIFLVFGWRFALFGLAQTSPMLGLNMLTVHVAWPLTGLVCILFLGEKLAEDFKLLSGEAA